MRKFFILIIFSIVIVIAGGCAAARTNRGGRQFFVYVAENGVTTFQGKSLRPAALPSTLLDYGVVPQDRILLIVQGEVPQQHVFNMLTQCANAGLANCTIITQKVSVSASGTSEKK